MNVILLTRENRPWQFRNPLQCTILYPEAKTTKCILCLSDTYFAVAGFVCLFLVNLHWVKMPVTTNQLPRIFKVLLHLPRRDLLVDFSLCWCTVLICKYNGLNSTLSYTGAILLNSVRFYCCNWEKAWAALYFFFILHYVCVCLPSVCLSV